MFQILGFWIPSHMGDERPIFKYLERTEQQRRLFDDGDCLPRTCICDNCLQRRQPIGQRSRPRLQAFVATGAPYGTRGLPWSAVLMSAFAGKADMTRTSANVCF